MRHTIAIEVAGIRLIVPDMFTPVGSGTDDPLRLTPIPHRPGRASPFSKPVRSRNRAPCRSTTDAGSSMTRTPS